MKRTPLFCTALAFFLLTACSPAFVGQRDPELGAPKGGQLDVALGGAVDLALAGGNPLSRGTDALPPAVRAGEAAQASLNKLIDGNSNTWDDRAGRYTLTAYQGFTWRNRAVRVVHVRLPGDVGWNGLAVRDERGAWIFVDRDGRWSENDTREFYKAIDRPGDGEGNSWGGGPGPCSVTTSHTDIQGDMIRRDFTLRVGNAVLQGKVSRLAKQPWQLEEVR